MLETTRMGETMSQAAAGVQSTIDQLTAELKLAREVLETSYNPVLPKSKIKIENLSKEPGVLKPNIDFSTLALEDIHAFFDYLSPCISYLKVQCLDFKDCNLFKHPDPHITEVIIEKLQKLLEKKFMLSPNHTNQSTNQKPQKTSEREILNCVEDILNDAGSAGQTKQAMLKVFQRNFIYNLTHTNANQSAANAGLAVVDHFRFLQHYIFAAKKRRKVMALLLTDLCRNSKEPEANPSVQNLSPNIVVFFNNPLYREGVNNRVVIDALLKLIEIKEISENNKVFLILHCQKILQNKPKDKKSHYKIWGLLYSLLCSELNKEIEDFLNIPANIEKEDMLSTLYWRFLQKMVGLTEADKKSYEEYFKSENHHLILAFRQNLDLDDKEKVLASHFDKFIKAVIREGNTGFRKLRYDETQNAHLQTVFSIRKDSTLKSLWSSADINLTFKTGPFKECQLICTDNYWDMMTWGFGINCLDPIGGDYKLLLLLLYGQHRAMILRDAKGKVIAGCMLHLLLHNVHNPQPCLALGMLYHRDRWQEKKEAVEIKSAIRNLFERLGATIGLELGIRCYSFYEKFNDLANDGYPGGIYGLGVFTRQGPITTGSYKAGLDGDFYDCNKLEHAQHGLCAIMYGYREINELPLSELKATGNALCFEWESIKTANAARKVTETVTAVATVSEINRSIV